MEVAARASTEAEPSREVAQDEAARLAAGAFCDAVGRNDTSHPQTALTSLCESLRAGAAARLGCCDASDSARRDAYQAVLPAGISHFISVFGPPEPFAICS